MLVHRVLELGGAAEHGHEEGRLAREPVAEYAAASVATARVGVAEAVITRVGAGDNELSCGRLLFRSGGHKKGGQGGRPHRAEAPDSGTHGSNDISDHAASVGGNDAAEPFLNDRHGVGLREMPPEALSLSVEEGNVAPKAVPPAEERPSEPENAPVALEGHLHGSREETSLLTILLGGEEGPGATLITPVDRVREEAVIARRKCRRLWRAPRDVSE